MQTNLSNRTIFCHDNLEVLRGIDCESIDLIYLDPPFNKKKVFTAPIGSSAEGAEFSDIFRAEDVKDDWLLTIKEDADDIYHLLESVKRIEGRTSYNYCYLAYMAIRLIETQRVLKPTGSLYLHCDPTMSHYLKILLDCIFGEKQFRNEIVWWYDTGGMSKKDFSRKHDIILRYVNGAQWLFNADSVKTEKNETQQKRYELSKRWGKRSTYRLSSTKKYPHDVFQIHAINPKAKERTKYPTQKPLALLERIILASSNPGNVVLDPFCGCATTCVAAERLGRQWIGIDVSVKAFDLVRQRLGKEVEWKGTLFEDDMVTFKTQPPQRTDRGADEREQKYVYIISNPQFSDEYKVGITSNVKRRLSSYQTGDPNRKYHLKYQLLTPHFRAIETHIHEVYENKHEWVCGKLENIQKAIEAYHDECERNHT